jgi:hypothetical protein
VDIGVVVRRYGLADAYVGCRHLENSKFSYNYKVEVLWPLTSKRLGAVGATVGPLTAMYPQVDHVALTACKRLVASGALELRDRVAVMEPFMLPQT